MKNVLEKIVKYMCEKILVYGKSGLEGIDWSVKVSMTG